MSNANLGVRIVLEDGAKAGFDALGLSALGLGQSLYGLVGIWNQLGDAGKGAALGVGILGLAFHGLMGLEHEAVDAAEEFQTAMNKVELSVNGADQATDQMKKTLVTLADEGVYSTTQLADGFAQLGIDGWNAKDIMDHMGAAAMYMGEAMRSDTTPAFNLLGTAMEMYHADASQATEFTKDLTFAFYNGQKSVTNLQQAMNMVGPAAHILKVPFGELTDVLALLGEAGLKGSQGASSLQYYLTNLSSPTSKARDELKALGVSMFDANGNFIGLVASIEKLGPALSKLSEKDRLQAIANLFNIRSGRDAREFFADFVATINKIGSLDQLRQGTDVMQKATSVTNTLAGSTQRLGTTFRDALKFIGDAQIGPLTGIVNGIQGFIHQFNMAGDSVHNNAAMFLLLVTVLTGLSFVVGGIALVFLLFGSAIATVAPWVAGVIAIVGGLIASFIIAKQAIESNTAVMGALRAILGVIGQAWGILVDQGKQLLNSLKLLAPVWDVLKVILAVVAGIIVGVLLGAVLAIIGVFIALAVVIRVVIQVLAVVGTAVGHFFSLLGTGIRQVPAVVGSAMSAFGTSIHNALDATGKRFTSWITGVRNSIGAGFSSFGTTIHNALMGAVQRVVQFGFDVRNAIQNGLRAAVLVVQTAIHTVVGWFSWLYNHNYYFQALVDKIRQVFNTARAFITAVWSAITSWLVSTWHHIQATAQNVWNLITAVIQQRINQARAVITSVWNIISGWLSSTWNNIVHTAQNLWNLLVSTITGRMNDAKAKVTGAGNDIKNVLQNAWNAMIAAAHSAWNRFVAVIAGIIGPVISRVNEIKNTIVNTLSTLGQLLFNSGQHALQMFIDGIKSKFGALGGVLHDAASKVAGVLGFHSPPKEGPLSDSDQYMPNMMKMFAGGIDSHIPLVHAAGLRAASALSGNTATLGSRFQATAGGGGNGTVIHAHLHVDGKEVADVVMDQFTGQFQNNGAGRWMR